MTREELLREAIRLSRENVDSGRGGPFGAVVAKNGEVVATGVNVVTSANDPTAHAEVTAIRAACAALRTFSLAGCEIFASCEPCPMCLGAIYWARLDAVYFAAGHADAAEAGFDDSFLYQEIPLPISERSLPTHHVTDLRDEANAAFQAWRANALKTPY
jgi:Cytosine/adenosine deaminases